MPRWRVFPRNWLQITSLDRHVHVSWLGKVQRNLCQRHRGNLFTTEMKAVPFNPSLPDVAKKIPKRAFSATNMLLLFLEDVPSIGGVGIIKYRFVLVAGSLPDQVPVCYVTLESSPSAINQLCAFDQEGGHANYATLTSDNLEAAFLEAAFDIVRENVGPLDQLRELHVRKATWWSRFWNARRKARAPSHSATAGRG